MSFSEKVSRFLKLEQINESHFDTSFLIPQKALFFVRLTLAAYTTIVLFSSVSLYPFRWGFFFTNLSYTGILIYLYLAIFVKFLLIFKVKVPRPVVLTTWFFYPITLTAHIIVPLVYWIILFPGVDTSDHNAQKWWLNVSTHGGDFVVILIEFILNAVPVYYSHFVSVLIITWLYIFYSMIGYASQDGWWVYPFLDFNTPFVALSYIGLTIGVCLIHFLWSWLFFLKEKFWSRNDNQKTPSTSDNTKKDKNMKKKASELPLNAVQTISSESQVSVNLNNDQINNITEEEEEEQEEQEQEQEQEQGHQQDQDKSQSRDPERNIH